MKSDAIAYVVAGICFGVILGWVIGTQQARQSGPQPVTASPAPQGGTGTAGAGGGAAPVLDVAREQALTAVLQGDPDNVEAAIELANVYYDAQRWPDAIRWYEHAMEREPGDPNVSTDLGVSYYNADQPDRALEQFEHSLSIDPAHTKTLFNKGIVLAFAQEDLDAAVEQWKRVVDLAPSTSEGLAARQMLEGVAAAHTDAGATSGQQ